jgi:hypothetical protein
MREVRSPVRCLAVGVAAALALVAASARGAAAACRASENKAFSYDTRLSPGAGGVCLMIADVFAGGTCGAPARWSIKMSCEQTKQMAISNTGRLVSILNPRTKRRDLNVIRISWSPEKYVWANLAKLEEKNPLRGEVRLSFDGDALKLTADRTVVIPFETLRRQVSSVAD